MQAIPFQLDKENPTPVGKGLKSAKKLTISANKLDTCKQTQSQVAAGIETKFIRRALGNLLINTTTRDNKTSPIEDSIFKLKDSSIEEEEVNDDCEIENGPSVTCDTFADINNKLSSKIINTKSTFRQPLVKFNISKDIIRTNFVISDKKLNKNIRKEAKRMDDSLIKQLKNENVSINWNEIDDGVFNPLKMW